MIVTEADAKEKWCPEARSVVDGDFSANRRYYGEHDSGSMCLGSSCMKWRWMMAPMQLVAHEPREGWEHVTAEEAPQHDEEREFWLEPRAEAMKRRRGYCGAAGVPTDA